MDNNDKDLLQNLKVLYVEDEEITREELSKIIKRRTGKLFTAHNGLEGLESFKKNSPDIIVTDLIMPNMDGLEMVKEIRKIDKDCKIIIVSALSDSETILNAVDIGIVKYIIKPVDTEELINTIEQLAEDILKNRLKEMNIDNIIIDKDKKHELEQKIKRQIALFIKTYSGKGPKSIDVFITANKIEVKANEALTLLELTLISNENNNSLVEYNRKLFYKEKKDELEKLISEVIDTKVELEQISIDSKNNIDNIILSFN